MDAAKIAIAGGGMVAGYAAKQFVEMGLKPGELTILSADSSVPYERPPLSKGFLSGKDTEESIRINPADFYQQHGIELKLNCVISSVDAARKRLRLKSGAEFGFEKLILATGCVPRPLDIPGAKLANILYLRSLNDSKGIQKTAAGVRQAVVIGGGFIGMEVASVLAQKGIEVTMVLREERIWQAFFAPQMSQFFEAYYGARGVRFLKNAAIRELKAGDAVTSAILGDGQSVPCQMVVAGIGAKPVLEILAGSGIETGDGVMVNEYLETSQPGILVAGDIANYPDTLYGKRRRVEHWDNAVTQGQYCAKALMGERAPFRHVPYFFSDVFDLSYEFWGDTSDAEQIVPRGDLTTSSFSFWWLRSGRLVAAFTMNRPDEERDSAPKWIESKQKVSAAKLADASQTLSGAALGD